MSADGRETSKCRAKSIAEMAARVFTNHTLTWSADDKAWTCRGTSFAYAFRLYTAPGVAVVWGDIGEFVLRFHDDGMGWLLTQGRKEERYPDYFLEKLLACRGPKEEFMAGDAFKWIAERLAEEEDGRKARWHKLRREFAAALDDMVDHPSSCWARLYYEHIDSDPPQCEGWTSGPLWLWHAVHCFTRLYDARPAEGAAA